MNKKNFLSFLYSLSLRTSIQLVGQLMVGELIALIFFPFIKVGKLIKEIPHLKFILSCLIVLLIAQIISDFQNRTAIHDLLRGWALILFSVISIIFIVNQLYKDLKSIVFFLVGTFIAALFFQEGDIDLQKQFSNTNYFKERLMAFCNYGILILSYFFMKEKKENIILLLFLFYSAFSFFLDARSNGIFFLLSFIMLFLKFRNIKISFMTMAKISIVALPLLYGAYILYANAILYDNFGGKNSQEQLAKVNNPYNPLELFIYGRTEVFVLAQAISERPIFGYGSWGKDPGDKFAYLTAVLSESPSYNSRGYIHAHSLLLGFWAYSGILGFIALLFLFFKLIKIILKIFNNKEKSNFLPLIVFLSINILWSALFSPIQGIRLSLPFFIALILSENYNQSLKI